MLQAADSARRRARARVHGIVQGVGFRPYVYRLAGELGLSGYVLNDSHGVLLEIEGSPEIVEQFLSRLVPESPPLAVLERIVVTDSQPTGTHGFEIRSSPQDGEPDAPITPDSATCEDCLRELFDPTDRRYRYPFINCTNCGPRFTIVRGVPYDRSFTTMADFEMCARCLAEYADPADRRFHAQPNACPECGPAVSLLRADGRPFDGGEPPTATDPLRAAADALLDGAIIAVKGIGGYHLACRADDQRAVSALRSRKHREDKPFALMAASLAVAQALALIGDQERELISAPARPIVLARRRADAPVADAVAPGAPELGVMLPYAPLHHLLLSDCSDRGCNALVMTSGNASEEPIAFHDEDAVKRLDEIADLFLVHDRPIETRTDDSVLRTVQFPDGPRTVMLRRSRGYVPARLPLPGGTPKPLLACGAELKNTFCVAKSDRAWVSHHVGDLQNYETLRSFTDGIEHFKALFAVEPEVVVHDLHPEYLSTKYAVEQDAVRVLAVQHHHAHLAACLAEHGQPGPAIGAIFDGTGYGTDGTVWGGELLHGDAVAFQRLGSLMRVRMPGGERAIREPWRMACVWLDASLAGDPEIPPGLADDVDPRAWGQVLALARAGGQAPLTSSMGRLFDAVAAICGVRASVNYEGQAAIELEAACTDADGRSYLLGLEQTAEGLLLDPREMIKSITRDLASGMPVGVVAARFHAAVAAATTRACLQLAAQQGTDLVVLSGGVFQNRRLLEHSAALLARQGMRVLTPEALPPGDGGIAYGQAAIAARNLLERPE